MEIAQADPAPPASGLSEPAPLQPFDLLVRGATVLRGGLGEEQYRLEPDASVGIRDGRIAWVGAAADVVDARADVTIDGRNKLALPGLINTHNHLFQNLVKGLGDEMYLLPWVELQILPTADEMTPEETYLGALLGCLEGIRSGTTAILDFMFGLPTIEHHQAVLRAMRDSGIRGFMGRATRELNPDSGGRDPWYLPLDEVFDQMRQLAREYPSGLPVPSVLPAPGTVRTMTTRGLMRVKEYAQAEGSQITIHMGEYTEERALCVERWGMGAFAKMDEIGFLGPDVVAAHCVKVDAAEREIIARTGTTVSYNPVSNMYLGNGVPPIVELLELGANVALATDGGACGNSQDMLEALRAALLIQRGANEDPRVMNARDIFRIATQGGAFALGLPDDLGAIEPGRLADLFLFDPYRLKSVPVHDPISNVVWLGNQANVDTVIVDGRAVLADGKFPAIDEDALVKEVHERAIDLSRRTGTNRMVTARRFTPFTSDRDDRLAQVASLARAEGANERNGTPA